MDLLFTSVDRLKESDFGGLEAAEGNDSLHLYVLLRTKAGLNPI